MSEHQSPSIAASDVTDAVQSLLQKILTDLKGSATAAAAGEPRLFFPNGIELISVVAKVGPADVEVKIAGEKGIKLADSKPIGTTTTFRIVFMDVWADQNKEDIYRGNQVIWYNDRNEDVQIVFPALRCPLNICDFPVPHGGTYSTFVLRTIDTGDYYFARKLKDEFLGNPKIIIK
jgi:hypothetical protein